jgi:hypothetical protein
MRHTFDVCGILFRAIKVKTRLDLFPVTKLHIDLLNLVQKCNTVRYTSRETKSRNFLQRSSTVEVHDRLSSRFRPAVQVIGPLLAGLEYISRRFLNNLVWDLILLYRRAGRLAIIYTQNWVPNCIFGEDMGI